MLIKVKNNDNSLSMVDDTTLESLIASDRIKVFCRSSGWVVIGRDEVRALRLERRRRRSVFNTYV